MKTWVLLGGWACVMASGPFGRMVAAEPTEPAGVVRSNGVYRIDLPTALRLAGARSLDVRMAAERLAEARAAEVGARWQFLPWVGVGAGWRRHEDRIQTVEGRMIDADKSSYSVGPTVAAQVDVGDAIFKSLSARQLVKAAEFGAEAQRQESLLAGAQGYFELARAQAAVAVAMETVRMATNLAGQVERAMGAGLALRADWLRAQVQAERQRLVLEQAVEQRRVASARLGQTLRLDPGVDLEAQAADLVPLQLVDTNVAVAVLLARAAAARPEVREAQARVEAARQARQGARYGPLVPTVGGQAFVGGLGGGRDEDPNTFGDSEDYQVTLGWRIGPGGLLDRSRVQGAESRLKLAQLGGEKVGDEIARQVVEAQARMLSQGGQLEIARRAAAAAEETLRLTQGRKEFGVGAVLEDIQAEQEYARARLDYLRSVSEFNQAQYALRRALGEEGPPR
jgi:outer membrane protein TolC